jgi:hypothetical protein
LKNGASGRNISVIADKALVIYLLFNENTFLVIAPRTPAFRRVKDLKISSFTP